MKFLFIKIILFFIFLTGNAQIKIDTILEKNTPKNLDLRKHQLFIDTTKNSIFQKTLKANLKSKDGYRTFKVIRKLKDEFVLYKRSDGNDPVIIFNKDSLYFYGIHEVSSYKIKTFIEKEEVINFDFLEVDKNFKKAYIESTNDDKVFIFNFYSENSLIKYWITPIEKIDNFNILVNSYPYSKTSEYNKFIEP